MAPVILVGMDYPDTKKKSSFVGKILLVAALTALCILMLKQSSTFNSPSPVSFLLLKDSDCVGLASSMIIPTYLCGYICNYVFSPTSSSMLKGLSIFLLTMM